MKILLSVVITTKKYKVKDNLHEEEASLAPLSW